MALKKKGILAIIAITILMMEIALLFLPNVLATAAAVGLESILIRLLGLYGFLFLSVAALTTPFLAGVTLAFGKPFKHIHHTFAAVGIVLITFHPIVNAVQRMSLEVFLPRFNSWEVFWMLAGRPALYLFYIGLAAAFLRTRIPKYWRDFHALIYIVLFFGIIHGNLIGEDFANLGIRLTLDALFAASMIGLVYKRYTNYRARKRNRVTI